MSAAGAEDEPRRGITRHTKVTQDQRVEWITSFAKKRIVPPLPMKDWTKQDQNGNRIIPPKDARKHLEDLSSIALYSYLRNVSWQAFDEGPPSRIRESTQVSADEAIEMALIMDRLQNLVRAESLQLLHDEYKEEYRTMKEERAALGQIVLCVETELKKSVDENTRLKENEAQQAETNAQVQTLLRERADMLQRHLVLEDEFEKNHAAALQRETARTVEVKKLKAQLLSSTKASQATKQQVDNLTVELLNVKNLLLASRDKLTAVTEEHVQEIDTLTETNLHLKEEVETQRQLLLVWNVQ